MALQDKIGRKPFVDKICNLVDSLQKDQNFCLSINGAWGSGKSFVLQMIEEQLSKKREYIIVKYDAWENTFYTDPLIAILSCVLDGIEDKLYLVERSEEKAKKAIKTTAKTLAKFSTKINALQEIISGIKSVLKSFHNPIDTDMESMGNFKSYQKLLKETKEVLNEITQKGEYREKQTKLIVLVDEIDRCLPDEQLKILERIHHLFAVKNCAVIVAMNQSCIAKTIQTFYGIDGYEYLRKFFDFNYLLDSSSDEYLRKLLLEFSESACKINNKTDVKTAVSAAFNCLYYGRHEEVIDGDKGGRKVYTNLLSHIDNREISRYYEVLLRVCNDFGWEKLTDTYVFFIIIGLFIKKNISSSFLYESVIEWKQKQIDDDNEADIGLESKNMPYYDYLKECLFIDRLDLPNGLRSPYMHQSSRIAELSWYFNEIVYYSIASQQYPYNQMRVFQGQRPVIVDDCRELRRLIILYGGEQER